MNRYKINLTSIIEYGVIRLSGLSVIIILLLILFFLGFNALPFLWEYNFADFLTGTSWYPLSEIYGALPLIYGSFLTTLLAIFFAIPLSLGTALFISEIVTPRFRTPLKISLEILASIPSVVFGFLGIILVGPFLERVFHIQTGLNALNAALLLSFMSVPTITSVAEEALQAVPGNLKQASLALGATRFQTMILVTLPAANPGIIAGVMLGIGRAIGETMTVMMVAGGAAQILPNIFAPVRTITGTIASEMGEVIFGDQHYNALFMLGVLLFFITMGINTLSSIIIKKIRKGKSV